MRISARYDGISSLIPLEVSSNSLETIRKSRGSKLRSLNSGADECRLSDLNTTSRALFCNGWSFLRSVDVMTYNMELVK